MKNLEYVSKFPRINISQKYLILKSYKHDFHKLYDEIIKEYMPIIYNQKTLKLKNSIKATKIMLSGEWEKLKFYPRIRETLITGEDIHFKNFKGWEDYFEYIDSQESFPLFKNAPKHKRTHMGPSPANLLAYFLIKLVSQKILLCPLPNSKLFFHYSVFVNRLITKNFSTDSRYDKLISSLDYHFKKSSYKSFIMTLTFLSTTIKPHEIEESEIDLIIKYYFENKLSLNKTVKKTIDRKTDLESYTRLTITRLPAIYIKLGANVNTVVQRRSKEKTIEDSLSKILQL